MDCEEVVDACLLPDCSFSQSADTGTERNGQSRSTELTHPYPPRPRSMHTIRAQITPLGYLLPHDPGRCGIFSGPYDASSPINNYRRCHPLLSRLVAPRSHPRLLIPSRTTA